MHWLLQGLPMPEATYSVGLMVSARRHAVEDARALPWLDLATMLATHAIRAEKDGPAWLPGVTAVGARRAERSTPWAVLPIDVEQRAGGPVPPPARAVADAAALWGLRCVVATSHSHTTAAPRYHLTLTLSRPIHPGDVKSAVREVAALLGFTGCVDEGATDAARLFYLPSCPPERHAQSESYVVEGESYDTGPALQTSALVSALSQIVDSGECGRIGDSDSEDYDALGNSPTQPPARKNWQPAQVQRLLNLIDPDQEYAAWFRTLAAVHYELGTEAGRAVALSWCATGSKFQGDQDFDNHWKSLGRGSAGRFTAGAHLLREAYPDGLPTWDHIGNARRISRHHDGKLMRVAETGQWLQWHGTRWSRITDCEAEDIGRAVAEDMPAESFLYSDADTRKKYLTWCTKSANRGWIPAMETLGAMPHVRVNAAALDSEPLLLGVPNGAVDLKTGQLLPPNPELRLTLCTSAVFDPGAVCPTFERVLSDVFFNDTELVAFFRRALGYSLLANPREELIFIPHGRGANGKSKIFEAVGAALGDYAKTCAAETLLDAGSFASGGGGAREDLVRLRGARLLVAAEPEEGARLRESLVKSMSGGDRITARAPYAKASIEIKPTWVTWMPTNHKPVIKGDDFGIWRRICLIPFERDFKNDPHIKADLQLGDKLRAEIPGILALLVRAAGEYLSDGLRIPQKVLEASESYRGEMDILATWIEEACVVAPGYEALTGQLWASWREFARERGLDRYIPTETAFGRRMEQRFPVRRTRAARYRQGIRLRDPLANMGCESAPFQLLYEGGT